MSECSTLNAIEFSNNHVTFRFIDISVQAELPLQLGDFVFIPGFPKSNSNSRINLPINNFSTLFNFNITKHDLSNNDFTNMYYAINVSSFNNLNNVSFSNSIVNRSTAVSPTFKYQQLKFDYVRQLLKDITGSIYMNGLFKNKKELVETIQNLDVNFNTLIQDKLRLCGTINYPRDNSNYYNNPTRILFENILTIDAILDTQNWERRAALISKMNTIVDLEYASNYNVPYYLYAKINADDYKYYYPINISNGGILKTRFNFSYFKINTSFVDSYNNVSNKITTYEYDNDYVFYGGLQSSNTIPLNMINYETLHNKLWPISLLYGDSLSVRLNYHPKDNNFCGKNVNDYAYEVYLDMGLETVYNMSYGNPNYVFGTANVVNINGINGYNTNGNASVYQHLFVNSDNNKVCESPSNLFISPYNFYPTLFDIQNIEFSTNVTTGTHNWYFSVYTRPYTQNEVVKFDRYNSVPIVTTNNVWETFNLDGVNASHQIKWVSLFNINSSISWSTLMDIPINSSVPYGSLYKIEDYQLMMCSIVSDNPTFVGTIKDVKVTFKDGRIIKMV
jgi:hypothetical protein